MKKDIEKIIEIPGGMDLNINGKEISVKHNGKEAKRIFDFPKIEIVKSGKEIKISAKKATKRESKLIGTIRGHIQNMIRGFSEGFVYKLEICNVHFPMNVKVEKDKLIIKSFLGETVDRKAKIIPNVKVDVNGHEIIVSSSNKEDAGQTAANIEKASKLKGRDRRVFQDGIFITEKPGRRM